MAMNHFPSHLILIQLGLERTRIAVRGPPLPPSCGRVQLDSGPDRAQLRYVTHATANTEAQDLAWRRPLQYIPNPASPCLSWTIKPQMVDGATGKTLPP